MRNLAQYPITVEEMVAAVERALKDELDRQKDTPSCGSIHGIALQEAVVRLKSHDEVPEPGYLDRISEIAELQDGWDGDQARTPTAGAMSAARKLAHALKPGACLVYPRPCGGLQFEPRCADALEFRIEASGVIISEIV